MLGCQDAIACSSEQLKTKCESMAKTSLCDDALHGSGSLHVEHSRCGAGLTSEEDGGEREAGGEGRHVACTITQKPVESVQS